LGVLQTLGVRADLLALSEEDLHSISGIGPALAHRIVAARRCGAVTTEDGLANVSGIGPVRLAALRAALNPAPP